MQLFSSLIVLCFASLAATRRTHYVTEYDIRTVYTDKANLYTPQVVTVIVTHTRDHTKYYSRTTTLVDPASIIVEDGTTKIKGIESEVSIKEIDSSETVNKAVRTTTASSQINTETKPQASTKVESTAEDEANTELNSNTEAAAENNTDSAIETNSKATTKNKTDDIVGAASKANTEASKADGDVPESTNAAELPSSSTKVSFDQAIKTDNDNNIDNLGETKASTLRTGSISKTPATLSSIALARTSVSSSTSSSSTPLPTLDAWADDIYSEIQNSPGIDIEFSREALDVTNKFRAIHHSPPVRWNKTAYEFAQKYADKYDCSLNLQHSGTQDFSENLGVNYNGSKAVIERWYAEEEEYDYATHNQYSHFTALVWKSSTQMGCAYKDCSAQNQKYIICNYSPTGNVIGRLQDNVFPP